MQRLCPSPEIHPHYIAKGVQFTRQAEPDTLYISKTHTVLTEGKVISKQRICWDLRKFETAKIHAVVAVLSIYRV